MNIAGHDKTKDQYQTSKDTVVKRFITVSNLKEHVGKKVIIGTSSEAALFGLKLQHDDKKITNQNVFSANFNVLALWLKQK